MKTLFKPSLLIVCAMNYQRASILQYLEESNYDVSLEFDNIVHCSSPELSVDVLTTGIGMINAASQLTEYLCYSKPDFIINTGCAISHVEKLKLGDIVLGNACLATSNVYIDKNEKIHHYGTYDFNNENESTILWEADRTLIHLAQQCSNHILSKKIHTGLIGSSDVRLDEVKRIKWMRSFFGTDCEDLEAAALAQVAHQKKIPFLPIKEISRSVFWESETHFKGLSHVAPWVGKNCAKVAVDVCDTIRFDTLLETLFENEEDMYNSRS